MKNIIYILSDEHRGQAMSHRLRDRGVPRITWMSHSGLCPGSQEVDDDWCIRGIDGRLTAGIYEMGR